MKRSAILVTVLCLVVCVAPQLASAQVGTAFTYQGKLTENGAPPPILTADFSFALYDAETNGNQIGPTIWSIPNGPVELADDGTFTVDLDFGNGIFDGSELWMQIVVRSPARAPNDISGFETLSPRQPIMPAPYAQYALNANVPFMYDGSNAVFSQGDVGIGTSSPIAKLSVVSSTTSSGNNTAVFSAPNIGPHASNIHHGTTGNWYIRSADSAGKVILQDTGGNVGIGTASPSSPLTVNGTIESLSGGIKFPDSTTQATAFTGALDWADLSNVPAGFADNIDNDTILWLQNGSDIHFSNGDVTIGAASAQQGRLTVQQLSYTELSGLSVVKHTGTLGPHLWLDSNDVAHLDNREGGSLPIVINGGGGTVGIGTIAVNNTFSVAGDADFSGAVGIGLANPGTYKLSIQQSAQGDGEGVRLINDDGSHSLQAWVGSSGAVIDAEGATNLHLRTDGTERLYIRNSSGNVGVGTTNPQAKLHVNGDIRVATTTRYLTFHPSAFVPWDETMPYIFDTFGDGGASGVWLIAEASPPPAPNVFFEGLAPVNLPHGATVTEVRVLVKDTDPNVNMTFSLRRHSISDGSRDYLAYVESSGTPGDIQLVDSSIANETVDNSQYSYVLGAHWDVPNGDVWLGPVRITYEINTPLP